jgi:hypothetical protein
MRFCEGRALASRFAGRAFPHEIGVFLGYPLKDVAAFMGWVRIPFACQGPWKIYGDPRESLRLAETFRCCRRSMAQRLTCCASPLDCLGREPEAGPGPQIYLDSNFHFLYK